MSIFDFISTNVTNVGGDLTPEAVEKMFQALNRQLDAAPPCPHVIRANHAVPYGHVFRMWDTKGRLIVFANQGEMADLPRAPEPFDLCGISTLCPPGYLGVPVVYED